MGEADVVLAVGTRFVFGQDQLRIAPDAQLILLNVDEHDLGDPRTPAVTLHADAAAGLQCIMDQLPSGRPAEASADLAALRRWAEDVLAGIEPQYSWVRALRAGLPEDGILVNEFTQIGYMAQVAFPVYGPRTYVAPGYQGTLGYGFPTALGARVAHPDRAVLSINGDGGFGWALAELATARKFGIGCVTVVFDDGAYGNVRRAQVEQFDGRVLGSELVNPDYVRLAESFGVRGARATTPQELQGLLTETLSQAETEPVLIGVPVAAMPSPFAAFRQSTPPRMTRSG
jgi:acetolactate synthase-1/2/3 large subunit